MARATFLIPGLLRTVATFRFVQFGEVLQAAQRKWWARGIDAKTKGRCRNTLHRAKQRCSPLLRGWNTSESYGVYNTGRLDGKQPMIGVLIKADGVSSSVSENPNRCTAHTQRSWKLHLHSLQAPLNKFRFLYLYVIESESTYCTAPTRFRMACAVDRPIPSTVASCSSLAHMTDSMKPK